MNRKLALALLAVTVNAGVATATAQTITKANIPFEFRVGSTLMPAGYYRIALSEPRVVWISAMNVKANAVALASTSDGSTAAPSKLVFDRYGDQNFLRELDKADGGAEMTFSESKLEHRLRSQEASVATEGKVLIALK